jgi:putative endonuclease
MHNKRLGTYIEHLARQYLQDHQLQLLTKNFTTKFGEIDLIFRDNINHQIVFVEVRYKKSILYGEAVNSVNKTKQIKLIKTAHCFLQQYFNELPISYRFDIIACNGPLEKINIDWIVNAFSY